MHFCSDLVKNTKTSFDLFEVFPVAFNNDYAVLSQKEKNKTVQFVHYASYFFYLDNKYHVTK